MDKELPIQWCDLVESEEPKVDLAAIDSADEGQKQEIFTYWSSRLAKLVPICFARKYTHIVAFEAS